MFNLRMGSERPKGPKAPRKPKPAAFYILNAFRVINVIVLTTIAISSAVLMVAAKMPNGFTFFSDISLLFLMVICLFLGLSECGLWQGWFAKHWPAFGPQRGLTWLGFSMLMMGSHTLGELSDDRYSTEKMGKVFWSLCLAAGILAIIFGFANVAMSWWFGKRQGISVRGLRADGTSQADKPFPDSNNDKRGVSVSDIGHPLPKYSADKYNSDDEEKGAPLEDRGSPIAPEIQRPLTSLHPAYQHESSYPEPPPSIHYSNHRHRPSEYSLATTNRF